MRVRRGAPRGARARGGRPGRPEAVAPLTAPADGRTHPRMLAFADAGAAVAALAAAARRAEWLRRGSAALSPPPDADGDRARSVVAEALHELPTGGQLDP